MSRAHQRDRGRRNEPRPGRGSGRASAPGNGAAGEWLKTILLTAVLLVVIRGFLVQTFVIVSGSMEDTLLVGDFLMVNRLALGTRLPGTTILTPGYSEPRRGDVLVFDPAHEGGRMKLVKRLIGMPGDTLQMRDGRLQINGSFVDEPYVKRGAVDDHHDPRMLWQLPYLLPEADSTSWTPTRDNWGPLAVPAGHYFMLGDNREGSLDARYWGLIERWRIEGRAMFFYFSYDRDSAAPFSLIREIRWDRIGNSIN